MSERDIPSRISHEQDLQMRAHRNNVIAQQQLPAQPRIQSSKSVPTLNEDTPMATINGQTLPPLQQRRQNEIPPPYSVGGPHPQYNSMPKSITDMNSGQLMKPPNDAMNSSRNYAPHNSLANYNTIGSYSPSRPESQMSMHSQQRMSSSQSQQLYPEERHYQNIQLYQIQPTPQKTVSTNSVPQRMLHSSHTSLQTDSQHYNPQQRPLSALVSNRESDQFVDPKGANSPRTPTSPRPPIAMNPNMMSAPDQFHYPQQQPQQYPNPRHSAQDFNESQQMLDYPSRNYPPPHPPYMDPRQRADLMRQEAKMDEMREEVRRREERMQSGGPQVNPGIRGSAPNGLWPHRQPYYPQQQMPGMNGGPRLRMAPPPAPKPRPTAAEMLSNYNPNSYLRNSYREPHDVPQGQTNPPPPPTVSYRYGPSGYPPSRQSEPLRSPTSNAPKTPFTDALNNSNNRVNSNNNNIQDLRKNNSGVVSPSPWEREEKERVLIFQSIFCLNICRLLTFQSNISIALQTTQGFPTKVD